MKKKLLVAAIASAMTVPSAFAAQDTSGMQYTSASEGFYASIRVRYNSGGTDDAGADIQNSSSRVGVRGSNDLGGGLEGFYQYEMGVGTNNGDSLSTRVGVVGLRGGFGQVQMGSFWAQSYNWVTGSTDIANVQSGFLNYTAELPGRSSRSIEYTTPDLNGFQGAIAVEMDASRDGDGEITEGGANDKDDNDVDSYQLSAKYDVQGLSVGATYTVQPDGQDSGAEDINAYAVKMGYAQDNWYVNGWYGEVNTADNGVAGADDTELFSLGGGVALDKVNVYMLHETRTDSSDQEDDYSTFGVQYNLGSRSRVWVEYAGRDLESNADADDYVTIGLRHDF